MTEAEVTKMFYMVKSAYPRTYKDFGKTETDNFIAAWSMVFADIPAETAFKGLKIYLSTEKTGFPPSPGQIIDCIQRLEPDRYDGEDKAWQLVERAVANSIYNAEEEFKRLPDAVKRVVYQPARLREWAQMDVATFQSVEGSNFKRAYRAEIEKRLNNDRIPQQIRPMLDVPQVVDRLIETKQEHERVSSPDEMIEEMIEKLRADMKGETA